jgi:hypothetical protein
MELQSIQLPASPQPHTKTPTPRTPPPSFERCRARKTNGSRCRLHADPATGLCNRHKHLTADPPEDTDLLGEFKDRFGDLTTALTVNDFLRNVAYLLVQNQMSNRRAAVLTTLCGHLLRTVPLIDKELGRRYEPDYYSSWRSDPDTSSTAGVKDPPPANAPASPPQDSPAAQVTVSVASSAPSVAPPTPPSPPPAKSSAADPQQPQSPAAKPPETQPTAPPPADSSPPPAQTYSPPRPGLHAPPSSVPIPPLSEMVYTPPPGSHCCDDIMGVFRPPPANLKRDPRYAAVWHRPSRSFTDG